MKLGRDSNDSEVGNMASFDRVRWWVRLSEKFCAWWDAYLLDSAFRQGW